MAVVLFITPEDIKRYSTLDGNVDNDKFIQHIEIAQEIHIQKFLGTDLYNKISSLILAGTIENVGNENYNTILTTYIKPMTIHWAQVELLPYIPYTITNGGVYKHRSETSETVDKEEIDYLVEKERNVAQHYSNRFISYMNFNQSSFPEFLSNSNDDIFPENDANFTGWVL
jgi:hypothetical protein